jgi:fucose 4-O-acetylase-like acetyltransferase
MTAHSHGQRNQTIDASKGLGIILVVIGHLIQYNVDPTNFDNNTVYRIIYSFHMPLFFMLSGLVARSGLEHGIHKIIKTKSTTLLIPFFFYFFIFSCRANPITFYSKIWMAIENPQNGLWFLYILFWVSIFHSVITKFENKALQGICTALILYLLLLGHKKFGADYVAFYLVFYIVGFWIKEYKCDLHFSHFTMPVRSALLGLVGIAWLVSFNFWQRSPQGGGGNHIFIALKFLAGLLGAISCWGLIHELMNTLKMRLLFLSWIGSFTLPIYAIHFELLPIYDSLGLPFTLPLLLLMPIAISLLARRHWLLNLLISGKRTSPGIA